MTTKRNRLQNRDTVKDIILGLAPSGQNARQPKEGVLGAASAESTRKRTNLNSDDGASGLRNVDYEDLRRQLTFNSDKINSLSSDVSSLRNAMDRQMNNLTQLSNELKDRPAVDPSKIASSTQQMDERMRDLSAQISTLKQSINTEKEERMRHERSLNDKFQRINDSIREQNKTKSELLNNIARRSNSEKEKLSAEMKRLSDKLTSVIEELSRNVADDQRKIRNEMMERIAALETASKSQEMKDDETARTAVRNMEERIKAQEEHSASLSKQFMEEREKQRKHFQRITDALEAFERNLEHDHKKLDTSMDSKIQERILHEKNLLAKITEVEDRLNTYVGNLTNSIHQVKSGKENVKIPSLDVDGFRREMEAIAADKNKMSMEGLLKLEEKMAKMQSGLVQDRKGISQQIAELKENDDVAELQKQLTKLGTVNHDMEKAQDIIRDKVDKQIPKDFLNLSTFTLNELSSKTDSIKQQLNTRIDKEEEERFLAIKELQEAFQKLQSREDLVAKNSKSAQIRRDLEECKVAIKKLAESVTTVKNVLDKKIADESKKVRSKPLLRIVVIPAIE
ncbi:hypothetical protein Q1695_000144 [Nippostrongylus brasiliensis]|nr:hypothetical protein Q1695_000144 [Nippostrongylus brasiliensis]